MPTDYERREVARRLRELEQGVIGAFIPTGELAEGVLRAIDYGHSGAMTPYGRLADLIEPDDPPYNLYTLYEAVFHRSPRCWACIEDDEVDELVDALLDICNAPGHDVIQRPLPSEPKVKCVAEVKIDGERLEELAHDAAVELTGIDRDALLALAVNLDARATELLKVNDLDQSRQRRSARLAHATDLMAACSRIREALGVQDV